MAAALYMDVHVPGAITRQLRPRGVDVIPAQEDGHDAVPDDDVLHRAPNWGELSSLMTFAFESKLRTASAKVANFPACFLARNSAVRSANMWKTWS
jgi:hypothetical protein